MIKVEIKFLQSKNNIQLKLLLCSDYNLDEKLYEGSCFPKVADPFNVEKRMNAHI